MMNEDQQSKRDICNIVHKKARFIQKDRIRCLELTEVRLTTPEGTVTHAINRLMSSEEGCTRGNCFLSHVSGTYFGHRVLTNNRTASMLGYYNRTPKFILSISPMTLERNLVARCSTIIRDPALLEMKNKLWDSLKHTDSDIHECGGWECEKSANSRSIIREANCCFTL